MLVLGGGEWRERHSSLLLLIDACRWADVPIKTSKTLFASGCQHGTPTVKYRGFFLNDEQPALQSWAQEKFNTNWTSTPFNHMFYSNVRTLHPNLYLPQSSNADRIF